MKQAFYFLLLLTFFESCAQEIKKQTKSTNQPILENKEAEELAKQKIIDPAGTDIENRIFPPLGFSRTKEDSSSFAHYLRTLPLKPHGSKVLFFDGYPKENNNTYVAVIDLKIGNKDLHQCADAVMRLRAEYLWKQQQYEDIHFNFTNGFQVDYSEWIKGKRMVVKGNKSYWIDKGTPSNTYDDFWQYMELIFSYAGTLSLSKEMKSIKIEEMKIGDVFIKGGSPGHAILVIDIAVNLSTQEKIFLLAQSYMPAQETQILHNPMNNELSPWYSLSEIDNVLNTPEWTFYSDDLKRF